MSEKSGWAVERSDAPIEITLVERLLEPWRGGRPVASATFLRGGLMNRNYRVRVGSDDVVLRFYDRDPRTCLKETLLLQALRSRLSVPAVLFAETNADPPFAVLEYVDGTSLRTLKKRGDLAALARPSYEVGRALATLASIPVETPLDGDSTVDPSLLSGSNVNARLIDHFLTSDLLRRRLGEADVERVRAFAWRRDDLLTSHASRRHVAHGDLNSSNILVRRDGSEWSLAAILDWEFAFPGNLYYDIGNYLRYERDAAPRFEPWFSRGLADGGVGLPREWRTIARLADLGALCELLTRDAVPNNVVDELRGLVLATVTSRFPETEA